jgi:hypothetical protein
MDRPSMITTAIASSESGDGEGEDEGGDDGEVIGDQGDGVDQNG